MKNVIKTAASLTLAVTCFWASAAAQTEIAGTDDVITQQLNEMAAKVGFELEQETANAVDRIIENQIVQTTVQTDLAFSRIAAPVGPDAPVAGSSNDFEVVVAD